MTTFKEFYSHFKENGYPIAIMSAFRGQFTYDQNVKRNRTLSTMVRSDGFGFVWVNGYWEEEDGLNKADAREDSILIIGNENDNGRLKGSVKKWMKKYDQDSVIYKDEDGKLGLLYQSGKYEDLGEFSPKKMSHGYTKLRGRGDRAFVFECSWSEPNFTSRLSKNYTWGCPEELISKD
jgi:hypothetical protein